MKQLLALLALSIAGFSVQVPPHVIPGKIYETSTEVITPSAGPRVDHGIDVFMTTEFLCYTARMDSLGYLRSGATDGRTDAVYGKTRYPDWRWKPGFKIGLGLNLPQDGWDVNAEYTWLHSSAWDLVNKNQNGFLPTWNIANVFSQTSNVTSIQAARINWKLEFNAVDLLLGRNFFVSHFLTLRPFVGFKGSWINQDYHVRYIFANDEVATTLRMKNDQSYWGIGLRSGINTAWRFTQTWGIYGNIALSALWSQFEVERKDSRTDSRNGGGDNELPLNVTVSPIRFQDSFHTLKGVLELGIGMCGEWWFFEDRYHFSVQAGWEEQLWFNHNQLVKTLFSQLAHGDLLLQGLTIKTRFDF